MADLKLLISGMLDEAATTTSINKQLVQIGKNLNISIGVNGNELDALAKKVGDLQKQINNSQPTITPDIDTKKIDKFESSWRKIVEDQKKYGTVSYSTSLNPVTKDVEKLSVSIEQTDGQIKKLKYELASLNNIEVQGSNPYYLKSEELLDKTASIREKQLVQGNKINKQLDEENQKIAKQKTDLEHLVKLYQERARIQVSGLVNSYGKNVNNDALDKYMEGLKNLPLDNVDSANKKMAELSVAYKSMSTNARIASKDSLEFGTMLSQAMTKFPIWMLASTAFYAPLRALQDMTTRLIEIDTLMTGIGRVMDVPDFKLTDLLSEAVVVSDELSSKLTDVLTIVGEFARMGDFSNSELIDISSTAQVLQNISDLDATGAVDTLTSAMLNFNITAAESIQISDKLNEVDNNFAISTKDLSDGIRKAASTAKTFGVDINELTGYIAAIGSTTRESGAIVGNGLKTIISRITTMEGAAGALESVNVSIEDMGGNVRPVSNILGELAGKWTTLSDEQKQNLGVTLAGRYQLSRFLALMNNFSIAQDATSTAINSAGSSMAEQEKYASSLEGRINRLDTAWTSFTLSAGEAVLTDGLIASIETLNDILSVSSLVVDKIGVLSGVFGTLGIAVFALSTKFRTFITALAITPASMTATSLATVGLSTSMTRASVATLGLTTAFRGLLIATGVGIAFAAVGIAVEKMIGAYSKAKQQQEEFELSQEKNIDALTANKGKTEELVAKYKELSAQRENGGLDTDKEKEYLDIMTQISQVYPALIGHIDATGQAHLKTSEQIDKEIELTNKLIDAKKEEIKVKAEDTIKTQIDEQKELQKEIDSTKKQIENWSGYDPLIDKKKGNKLKEVEIKELETLLAGLEIQVSNASMKINDEVLKVADAFNKLEINPSIQKDITNLVSSMDLSKLSSTELEAFSQKLAGLTDNMQRAFTDGNSSGFKNAKNDISDLANTMGATDVQLSDFTTTYDKTKTVTEQMASATYEATDSLDEYGDVADGVGTSQDELNKRIQDAKDNFSELASIVTELTKAKQQDQAVSLATNEAYSALSDELSPINELMEKMAEGKSISADEAMRLIQQEEELAGALKIENGMISINEKAVIDLRDAKVASFDTMIKAQQTELNAQKKALLAKLGFNALEIKGIQTVAQARLQATQKMNEELSKVDPLSGYLQSNNYMAPNPLVEKSMNELAPILEAQESIAKLSEMASAGLTQVGTSMADMSDESEKSRKETEKSTYVSDKYKLSLEQVQAQLAKISSTKSKYSQHSSAYRKALETEIKLLKEQQSIYNQQSKDLSNQIRSGNIRQTGIVTSPTTGGSSSSTGSYSGQYSSYINQAASKYGVDPNLIAAIIKQESNFNTNARSSAGARGLMQLMPGTASGLGVKNSYDPFENIMGGTKYIADQLKAFGGDLTKALAAYNAGPGNVRKYNGVPPFKETQNYVKKVLANFDSMAGSITKSVNSTSQSVADYYLNNFRITSKFGAEESFRKSPHTGLDLANGKQGDSVKALRGGKVVTATYSKSAGYWVVVEQDDGTVAKYMHMQKGLDVKAGQTISAGQQVGKVGNTGSSTGAHLDIKIQQNGSYIDPEQYIRGLSASGDQSKLVAEQAQSIDQAKSQVLQLGQDISGINEQISALQLEIVNSQISGFEYQKSTFDDDISRSEYFASLHSEWTMIWRKYGREKLGALEAQKNIHQSEIQFIQDQIKHNMNLTTAQRDSLSETLRQKEVELYSYADAIRQANMEIKQSGVDEHIRKANEEYEFLTDRIQNLSRKISLVENEDDQDAKLEYLIQQSSWMEKQRKQAIKNVEELRKERKVVEDFPDLVRQIDEEIKNWQLSTADLSVEMSNVQEQMKDIYNNVADEIIDIYKEVYEAQREEAIKAIDDEMDAYRKMVDEKLKLIDKEEDEDDYNKDLAERQKVIAELEKKINNLSMDDSLSSQSKVNDLQKELEERQKDLDEFTHDREVKLRKDALQEDLSNREDALNEEKEQVETHYDNLINNEREWAKMRENILAGNLASLTSDMTKFADFINSTMDEVGKSISLNLIDRIGEAQDLVSDLQKTNKPTNNEQFYYQGERVDTNKSDFDWDEYSKYKEAYVTALQDTEIFTMKDGKLAPTGDILKKGKKIRAYGRHGGVNAYGLGGNEWVQADGRQVKYERFKSGGFTGNSEGLAYLDKKEIVLKETDSSNFLKAVNITRDIFSKIPKITIPKLNPSMTGASNSPNIQNLIHIENFNGTKAEVDNLAKTLTNKLTKLGVRPKL